MGSAGVHRSVLWAAGLSAVSTVGLGVVTWVLVMMDALVSGVLVIAQREVDAVDPERYLLAFGVGALVNLVGAPALAWGAASLASSRGWPPPVLGVAAAVIAGTAALWALLRVLGIGLVELLSAL